ncbi:apolipoprotein N-acyltransferase [Paramagnetospirillum kuznetsovii]|uniref:Apolipoprotein N-acyltransferase n=1 Tax=Paramagnetospirillum kuznetsovii TaxID=2053833 RepID=A0A364P3B6_9PROT|nr:apolipoprotein N-acyltransferase [Paramagnetospirillum kuznetsovii]RAU23839.1 apolipoprotein N-acyltransferase [Paramagnetospirillum kuznetsovii]
MSFISTAALRLKALSGWRRRLALFLLGCLAALALPPVHALPTVFIAFPALVWIFDASQSRKAAYGAGWWWAMGWFSVGFYWISNALLTDVAKFGWMIPFAIFGLSGLVAAFFGAATLAVRALGVQGSGRIALLAVAWTLADWLRSWVLTGFPWNPLGSVWDISLPVLQAGAVVGIWGLGLLSAVVVMLPALLAEQSGRKGRAIILAMVLGLPVAGWIGGTIRLSGAPDLAAAETYVPGVKLRLVQAVMAQGNKWRDDLREANLREHVALSRSPGVDSVTTVVWPETAAPYFLDLDTLHREIAAAAAPVGGHLLTGAPRITPKGVEPLQIWNSLFAVTARAEIVGVYDKAHLVPFGEYVPFKSILPIAKITHGGTDFSAGPGPRTLTVPGLPPFSPLICYEAIFPAAVVDPDAERPQWLLTITNDGWFGMSAGPYQHLAAARMRAIEEGLPLVRAANTGISAVFDPYGREVARLALGVKGVVDAPLPKPIEPPPYGRYGNATAFILMLICLHLGSGRRKST